MDKAHPHFLHPANATLDRSAGGKNRRAIALRGLRQNSAHAGTRFRTVRGDGLQEPNPKRVASRDLFAGGTRVEATEKYIDDEEGEKQPARLPSEGFTQMRGGILSRTRARA